MGAVKIETDIMDVTPKTALVRVTGYVQTKEARELQRLLAEVDKQEIKRVVLDFTEVAYASSAALGLLVSYSSKKKKAEGTDAVAIVGLSENIRNVLDTLGLLPLFLICESSNVAFKKLGVPLTAEDAGNAEK